eukprot:TRINITY_DN104933_c0_g1_i1.p1 TRINITY_DN104933_c0_g1~~TRINITY_DN104933_c0_g1_i1.p1  ORF type:complete len:495 (+),score=73.25 TRINITY_DN104933_c0_g1_i1:32-1486(+)
MSSLAAWLGVFLGFLTVDAQIKVMNPQWLVRKFRDTHGKIFGSTSTFGAPFYGDRVLGRLAWGESIGNQSHCTDADYQIPTPPATGRSDFDQKRLINIIMVRRGSCSFTTKVKVAAGKGAHAVIIVDRENSDLTAKDMANIIVADDGYGGSIHIPSILVSKEDGNKLIRAVKANVASPVVVELAWDLPMDSVVTLDLWMSSASHESNIFLKEFASKRRTLNQVMTFKPHYAVFSVDSSDSSVYSGICSDDTGEFCAEDPDGAGDVTGKDVLEENVRQLCIHENTQVVRTSLDEISNAQHAVVFAAKYWDYMEKYLDSCPLDGTSPENKFGQTCSMKVMRQVGIDPDPIITCASTTMEKKLKQERRNQAWSPRALRINGWRYSGMLNADLVTRAVCSGFVHQPSECETLIKPRDVFKPFVLHPSEGVSFGTMLLSLVLTILFGFSVMLLYKRYLKKEMRTTLREEVMLEVQAQMGQYSKLSSGGV